MDVKLIAIIIIVICIILLLVFIARTLIRKMTGGGEPDKNDENNNENSFIINTTKQDDCVLSQIDMKILIYMIKLSNLADDIAPSNWGEINKDNNAHIFELYMPITNKYVVDEIESTKIDKNSKIKLIVVTNVECEEDDLGYKSKHITFTINNKICKIIIEDMGYSLWKTTFSGKNNDNEDINLIVKFMSLSDGTVIYTLKD